MTNRLERFIRYLSPIYAARRERARVALRMYDAADPGRRTTSFRGRGTAANVEIQRALVPLRDRSRDFARNSAWGPRALDLLTGYVIGNGWRPIPKTGSDRLDTKVIRLWEEWNAEADIEGLLSFDAQQALLFRSAVESGDVVVRFITERSERGRRKSKIPLKLQVLEGDLIDHSRDGTFADIASGKSADTIRSRLGVGLGAFDRRTGLWLFDSHPGDQTSMAVASYQSSFYRVDDVMHVFKVLRPGQVRGVPWFAPALLTGRDLADMLDALIVKARTEASFSAFITNTNFESYDSPLDENAAGSISRDNPNAVITTLEPGMIKELEPGRDIKFAQPTTASQVEPMLKHPLMAMAAALGITYEQFSGDLSGSNYISLRAGKIDFRRLVEQTQYTMVEPMVLRRVWKRFIDYSIMAGELAERGRGYPCDWVTPAWESVNPKFDQDAAEREVRTGKLSPQEYVEANGRDWRKVQDDSKEFFERADKLGLVYDIDPRNRTRQGNPVQQGDPHQQTGEAPAFNDNGDELSDVQQEAADDAIQEAAAGGRAAVVPFPGVRRALPKPKKPRKPRSRKAPAKRDREFNEEDHPRDDDGKFTDGAGGGGGGEGGDSGGSGSSDAASSPAASSSAKSETTEKADSASEAKAGDTASSEEAKPAKLTTSDFEKANVNVNGSTPEAQQAVIDYWEENIALDPAVFVKDFFGGAKGRVTIAKNGNELFVSASVEANGKRIGDVQRYINPKNKTATSAYFKIDRMEGGRNIGKQVLAGNVAMYKRLGIETVSVHANIDVGGYAWAKYGYVPTRASWNELRERIANRLDGSSRGGSGGGDVVESWDMVSDDQRDEIFREWAQSSRDEFVQSEVDSWRENGGALDEGKAYVAENPDEYASEIIDVVAKAIDEDENSPFTSEQIADAIELSYDRDGEGRGDIEVTFDDSKLTNPKGYDPDQETLPGIEKVEPHQYLSDDQREKIVEALQKKLDRLAQDKSEDIDPPEYIADNIEEYQRDYWEGMRDEDRYEQANRLGLLPTYEADDEDEEPVDDAPDDDRSAILKLTQSNNPKSLWAIADSPMGKRLLLNSDWNGTLDLTDAETMARFDAYIAKGKK